jgi:nitrate reductase NapE component
LSKKQQLTELCRKSHSRGGCGETREVFSMWILLVIFAGALLAAYGFFVWRHETQRRQEVGGPTRRIRRAF